MSLTQVLTTNLPPFTGNDGATDLSADLARQFACTPVLWQPLVRHLEAERYYVPLFANDRASGWLITWAPGTALEFHDHGDAAGALALVQGSLSERYTDRAVPGPLAHRTLAAGSVTSFGPDHVHEVRNLGSVPAISIHVYTPSLDNMTFYGALDADGEQP